MTQTLVLIFIAVAIVLMAVLIWWTLRSASRAAARRKQLGGGEPPAIEPANAYRKTGLLVSFSRGIGFLKEHTAGRDYRYEVPWILMVGTCNCGASTVLANAGASAPLRREGGPSFGQPGGLEWWFYQDGVVLNPPSEMILRGDGRSSDELGFDLFLSRLVRKGPRRPLDGIVLTISADELLDAPRRSEIIGRASVIRGKLSLIRRRLSMRVPIYVLVTKCDRVYGFSSFAAELKSAHRNMFGWSNPYPFDAAFSAEWVDQGFEEMQARIAEQQMEIFVDRAGAQDPDGVFLFPAEFQNLREPLRAYLAQALQDNAYEESFFFRGFYFTGDASVAAPAAVHHETEVALVATAGGGSVPAAPVQAELPAPDWSAHEMEVVGGEKRPVFLEDLFAIKLFPESRLARPLSRVDMSRNRTVLAARILTALFLLVVGIGTLSASLRLYSLKHSRLTPLFAILIADMNAAQPPSEFAVETAHVKTARMKVVSDAAGNVLGSMGFLSARKFGSVFIPASWNGRLDDEIESGLAVAFQQIVLQAFRIELDQRLAGPSGILKSTTPPPEALLPADRSYDSPEAVPQYQAWTKFIGDLRLLEQNINRYNRISSPGRGEIADFRELVKYLNMAADLPEGFDFDNPYFKRILNRAQNRRFDYHDRNATQQHARELIAGFCENWFGKNNRLDKDVGMMVQTIDDFAQRSNGATYEDLKDLSESITATSDDLQSPAYDWVSQNEFPAARFAAFAQPVSDLVYLDGFDPENVLSLYGAPAFAKFQGDLRAQSTRLTGRVLDLESTPADVSGTVSTLRENLSYLLSQPFVARAPGPPMQLMSARYLWDRGSLLEAKKLFDAYDRFDRGSLRSMPNYMSGVLRRVALQGLQQNVLDLVGQAQSSVTQAQASDIDRELQAFTESSDVLDQVLAGFSRLPDPSWSRGFSGLLQAQALRMLKVLEGQLNDSNPYGVRNGNFDWWEGEKPLSLEAFEVHSPDELKEYLERQRTDIANLVHEAEPLIKFLDPKLSGQRAQGLDVWRSLQLELTRYGQKKPGNSVAMLEDFVQTGMDKISPDLSCQDASRDPANRADLFLTRRSALRAEALARCRVLSQRAYMNQIAAPFNSKLAGRFPFASADAVPGGAEADPAAVADLLKRLDQYGKIANDTLKQSQAAGKSRDAALAFLSHMAQIRPMFSPFLAGFEKDPAPAFDFAVTFRVNPTRAIDASQIAEWGMDVGQHSFQYRAKENSGQWRLGDPIRVTLRFADDSPMLPVADPAQPDMSVNRRVVSFEFTDAWSLFRLLASHKPNRGEVDAQAQQSYLLSFYIPTMPDHSLPQPKDGSVGGFVRVYLRLMVLPPGAKEGVTVPVPFPDAAPTLAVN